MKITQIVSAPATVESPEELIAKMEAEELTKTEMAERLETSRSALNRLLDPSSETILNVYTLAKVAQALGKRFEPRFRNA